MSAGRLPCVIGVAQRTIRPEEGDAPEPLDLWEEMARAAAKDSGGQGVVAAIQDVNVVYPLSWTYDDPPGRVAERLGLGAGGRHLSGMSGTSSQKMLSRAAEQILKGDLDVAFVVGAESLATKKRMKKAGLKPQWSYPPSEKPVMPFEDPFHPAEMAHQVFQAYLTFALFDIARRGHLGLSPEENLRQIGQLFAPMTKIAAANPRAWFRREWSAKELIQVSESNRMVAYPYPKSLVSVMDIDMAAGLILASDEKADALGVPKDRRVYLRGWCSTKDPVYVAERADLWRSVGMQVASRVALETAGVGLDDIAHLDLYSCFGSSVSFARDALGIGQDDGRPMTVTGGLPFHGGPGSNYLAHSVATMVERLRESPAEHGMVSGVGMHMTHHTYAVYSATPGPLLMPDEAAARRQVDAAPRREIRVSATGSARIVTYSVVHGREGRRFALAVCDLPEGERCYARSENADLMRDMEAREWVGRDVTLVEGEGGVNLIEA
ncbi:MAG: acetyl-CoA synthetase [Deltaproteobacteria bacterium]|nr:acetyl-CoA synthetase [Deltaproteobacteria bacterium]